MILLMGDMNDNLGLKKGEVRNFLESVGMKVTFEERHRERERNYHLHMTEGASALI